MPDTSTTSTPLSSAETLLELRNLPKHLHLPEGLGFSLCSVHDVSADPPPLPAALGRAVAKRQREYLAGRRCAREALLLAGYSPAFYPAMGEDRLPVWPQGWLGSISHSGDYAMAVAADQERCSSLGVDIQQQASEKTVNAIQSMIAKPEELLPIDGVDAHTRLLLIFSGKESLYKALYPQVRKIQEFDAAKLVSMDARVMEFELTRDWSSHWTCGARLKVNYAVVHEYMITLTYLGS